MLTSSRRLAKISQTPGKTRLINHFMVNEEWFLVDLPGYGYAKISKTERKKWKEMINAYLLKRKNLVCTFILVDSRHEPQKSDTEFMAWMSMKQLPFVIVFTKSDKLSRRQLATSIEGYIEKMLESWELMPQFFITSANTALGRDDIIAFIRENNAQYVAYMKSLG
jgi:GTP-binding protein